MIFALGVFALNSALALPFQPVLRQHTALPGEAPKTAACPAIIGPGSPADPTYDLRKQAFDALAAGPAPANQAEARRLMRCAVEANPKDLAALRQLVYLDLNAGADALALEDVDSLRAQNASEPRFEAQEGYILFKQKRYDEARRAFERAAAGPFAEPDPAIRADALRAIAVIDAEYPAHALEVAVDGQYLNRFNDGIVDAYARYFQRLGKTSPLRAYAGVRLLRDTASQISDGQFGPLPQIFSDNALLSGVGLAFQPHDAHYFVSAEANLAYVFYGGRNNTATTRSDFRTVAGYYNVFRPAPDSRFSFQANGSVGFYSRYSKDVIAYLQPQETYDLSRGTALRVSPFFQQSFAFDTNQQFYNNTAELIPGLQFSLARYPNAALRAEYVRGFYLPFHTNSVNPYGSTYNDFRVRLTFDKLFLLHGAPQPAEPAAGAPH